jgi:carbamoyltransferase
MSAFGDPSKHDLSQLIQIENGSYRINEQLIWVGRSRRYRGLHFPQKLVQDWGPVREGDELSEPYIHVAAAIQKALEDVALSFVDGPLAPVLERNGGRLCIAGGCALNVRMNRKLIEHPNVSALWVQPAAHDSGTSVGAAALIASRMGDRVQPMTHPYLGPEYDDEQIGEALDRFSIPSERPADIIESTADLLADGHVVAWFQGRMEYGPRALGNRSILGHPGVPGMSDEINGRIKFREKWRPFCPSIKKEFGPEILGTDHDSPYMTFSFTVTPKWRERIAQAVHIDETCRPQLVTEALNPRFYKLLSKFEKRTGLPVLLNTSLNRRGEPMVCSPADAIAMFYGSGLDYLVLGDRLVRKQGE